MSPELRTKRRARIVALVTLIITAASLTFIASAAHGDATLDVTFEDATVDAGQTVLITAILTEPATDEVNIDFELEGGNNDTDGVSRTPTPDRSCLINDQMLAEPDPTRCTISYVAAKAGTDTWRIWVDEDGVNTTDESDESEGDDGDDAGGSGQNEAGLGDGCEPVPDTAPPLLEPDCTDVIEITVRAQGAGSQEKLDCDDSGSDADKERETNPSGGANSSENYQCTVTDANGVVTAGAVYGEIENTVNDPDATDGASHETPDFACGAGANGRCDISVTQAEGELGTADICFWIPTDDGDELCDTESVNEGQATDGSDTPNDEADRVNKTWAVPATASATASSTASSTASASASATPSGTSTSAKPTSTRSPSGTGQPSRAERTVTLTSSDDRVPAGRTVTLSGTVASSDNTCTNGETLTLKRRLHGSTTDEDLAQVTTDEQGAFSTAVLVRKNADYVVEIERTDDCEFAASNSVTVLANAKVRGIKVRDKTPERGDRVVVQGQIVPQQDGTNAVLKRKKGRRFVKVDVDRLNQRSRARFIFRASWTGRRVFRIFWYPGSEEDNERARSKAFRISSHR